VAELKLRKVRACGVWREVFRIKNLLLLLLVLRLTPPSSALGGGGGGGVGHSHQQSGLGGKGDITILNTPSCLPLSSTLNSCQFQTRDLSECVLKKGIFQKEIWEKFAKN